MQKLGLIFIFMMLVFTPYVQASTALNNANLESFFAGMVFLALLSCMQHKQSIIHRALNLLSGIAVLSFLSINSSILLIIFVFLVSVQGIYLLTTEKGNKVVKIGMLVTLSLTVILSALVWFSILPMSVIALVIIPLLLSQSTETSLIEVPFASSINEQLATNSGQGTSLPDRALLKQAFNQWQQNGGKACIFVLIKFDGLNDINQRLGRELSDVLLTQLASKVKKQLTHEQLITILEFDEEHIKLAQLSNVDFVFVIGTNEHQHLHEKLIQKIQVATEQASVIKGQSQNILLRAAFAKGDENSSIENLIEHTYLAIDSVQCEGDRIAQYRPEMSVDQQAQLKIIGELAVLNFDDAFELHFHPVVELETNNIEFVELLLRWKHPEKGLLSASSFVEEIRLAGLAYEVAIWVFEKAAEISLVLKCQNMNVPVSINLFGAELLQDEFIEKVDAILTEHKLTSQDIIIECPANILTNFDDSGSTMLKRLKAIGLPICLDDVGASPLSLANLSFMPLNYIKIDEHLIEELSRNVNARSLLSGIIDMGNNLQTKVICEGIESEKLLEFIKGFNCYGAQGYVFTRPLNSEGLTSWLMQWQKKLDEKVVPYHLG
jgi:EAL domain-containing protein (putative c-di-GMP-specific phosphodiesterase class I)